MIFIHNVPQSNGSSFENPRLLKKRISFLRGQEGDTVWRGYRAF